MGDAGELDYGSRLFGPGAHWRGWSKNIFLHVLPGGDAARLPQRIEWAIDDREPNMFDARARQPTARGSMDFGYMDPMIHETAVSRLTSMLRDSAARVFSCRPLQDAGILRSLAAAHGSAFDMDIQDIAACFATETLDLYSAFLAGGRDCREEVSALASALVETARDDLGTNLDGEDPGEAAMAMWTSWKSLRGTIEGMAATRMIAASGCLLWASRAGCHVRVALGSPTEIDALGTGAGNEPREELAEWSIVAIRNPATRTMLHAMGRLAGHGPWMTSPLVAVNRTNGFVETKWDGTYCLRGPGCGNPGYEMRDFLKREMRYLGYDNVRGHTG